MCIRSKSFFFASTGVVALAASLAMASTAMATTTAPTTIISDTFPSTQGIGSAAYLQGSSPDVGPSGSTWVVTNAGTSTALTSSQEPFISSSAAYFPNSSGTDINAAIGFTPNGNGILSFTTTENFVTGSWLAMGFADSASTADPYTQSGPFFIVAGTGNTLQLFSTYVHNPSKYVDTQSTARTTSDTNTFTFTYDPATLAVSVEGSNAGSGSDYINVSYTLTSAPTIGSIYLASRGGSGSFSALTLTQGPAQVVPEPAPAALLGLGGVAGLLLLGRRRKLA